ncbi:MAG: ImmA/IrrE family metallo-endopeptidase [bacterium]|nr:ImmA/IrrE family metallo-endopeptidase [bacterium]
MPLIDTLKTDFASLNFEPGKIFYWSPKHRTIYFNPAKKDEKSDWSLIHEVSHAVLEHENYNSDFELLKLEVEAWEKAKNLASNYDIKIDNEHIQDCLDTYRDWLHARSRCPVCDSRGLQVEPKQYQCSQCGSKWQVSLARFCRPYRMQIKKPPNN